MHTSMNQQSEVLYSHRATLLWGQAPGSTCRSINIRVSVMCVLCTVLKPVKRLTWGYTFILVQGVETSQHMRALKNSVFPSSSEKLLPHVLCSKYLHTQRDVPPADQLINANEATRQWQKKGGKRSWHSFWITGRANKRLCCQKHKHAATGNHVFVFLFFPSHI